MNIKIGEHFNLSGTLPTAGDDFFTLSKKLMVEVVKTTDQAIVSAIIEAAKRNGITDLYVLNEDFVMAAIREKMERDGGKGHGKT